MAITANPVTGVIFVPKADTTLVQSVPTEIRELDTNAFRLALRDIDDDEANRWAPDTHTHNVDVNVSGTILADVVIISDYYTIEFEAGAYGVNLVGTNSNIMDKTIFNGVSVRNILSGGLVYGGMNSTVEGSLTMQDTMKIVLAALAGKLSGAGTGTVVIRDTDDTIDRIVATTDPDGNRITVTLDVG